jgi:2-polyprenyl-6-methoxyphenol hydroxylase-like FAD-dependent oxidoreductase
MHADMGIKRQALDCTRPLLDFVTASGSALSSGACTARKTRTFTHTGSPRVRQLAIVPPAPPASETEVKTMVDKNSEMDGKSAVVVGGGIGGLTAAVALRQVGWRVTVLERAARFGEIGAGITLLSNGLRCLDVVGLGDAVRGSGLPMLAIGMRTAAGRWLSRIDGDGTDLEARMGTTTLTIHRAELHKILRDALPPESLIPGVTTTGIRGGADGGPAEVRFRHQDHDALLRAELVVGADGVHSWVRIQRWPDAPAPVYSGSTTWRAVTTASSAPVTEMSLSWGQGTEFGVMPLLDGRTYWYAAANADEGQRNPDELQALRQRFGTWHEPIPTVLAHTPTQAVLRHDIYRLPKLDRYHQGSVVLLGDAAHAMTPNLGQGGGQALEDAIVLAASISRTHDVGTALAHYDRERRARTQAMSQAATRQLRFGQQLTGPVAVALRNAAVALTPDRIALLAIARYGKWCPPTSRVL